MACSFYSRCDGHCGPSKNNADDILKRPITDCKRDISKHLRCYQIPLTIETESDLILARAGIFEIPAKASTLLICEHHRESLGLNWRRNSKYCQVPKSVGTHKSNRIADRGIGLLHSKMILQLSDQIIPVGSGKDLRFIFFL